MKDNRRQPLPLIVPVLWTVAGLIWLATFVLDLCKGTNPSEMVVLHGISAALGLILIAVSWLRYFRERNSQDRQQGIKTELCGGVKAPRPTTMLGKAQSFEPSPNICKSSRPWRSGAYLWSYFFFMKLGTSGVKPRRLWVRDSGESSL